MCKLSDLFKKTGAKPKDPPGMERPSPSDWIRNGKHADCLLVGFYRDDGFQMRLRREFLNVELDNDPYATPTDVTDTGSMEPMVDAEGGTVCIWGYTPSDHNRLINYLGIGDVACYQISNLIMHRISYIAWDGDGRGFTFLGDNNQGIVDPYLVRDSSIKYIVVGTIY